LDEDRKQALKKLKMKKGLIKKLPGIECGYCGAPDCKTLADDIARGDAKLTDCRFFSKNKEDV
jgi:Na+-translocating ferredoxin:NAD+ oxidoreductase RNF subunit RnfB